MSFTLVQHLDTISNVTLPIPQQKRCGTLPALSAGMTTNQRTEAVTVKDNGCEAVLEIDFKLIDRTGKECSDNETFSVCFTGRSEQPVSAAKNACVEQARQWANFKRLEGYEVSAWDKAGNTY